MNTYILEISNRKGKTNIVLSVSFIKSLNIFIKETKNHDNALIILRELKRFSPYNKKMKCVYNLFELVVAARITGGYVHIDTPKTIKKRLEKKTELERLIK